MARFDWYQASVSAEVPRLLAALGDALPGQWERLKKAQHGYAFAERRHDVDGRVCDVWWGGLHERPHVVSSGAAAHEVAGVLRSEFAGEHGVSRADVCIDYAEPGAYERLQGIAIQVAEAKGVRVGTAGDHLLTKQGRTVYLGAPSSHTRLRIYDKATELRQQFKNDARRLAEVPEELARLEVQVRPQTPGAKAAAASAEPMVLFGSAAWTRELMRIVAGEELEPFQAGKVWRASDDARAWSALLAQYGGLLKRRQVEHGSWECLGLQIGVDLEELEESRTKRRR